MLSWFQIHDTIQNNMRDIDAAMDGDRYVADLKSFDCNVAMVGVGGITSFYPTKLEYQVVSPWLPEGKDLIRELIDKCHAEGIRVIGRFDFGRTHEKFYEDHKDWYYHAKDGRLLRCANCLSTCISGWYQTDYSLTILRDALERFPDIDGIFFNAFGFSGWDYYGNNLGVCHCENCQRKFREQYGLELPWEEVPSDPAYEAYQDFKRRSIAEARSASVP